MDTQRKSYQTRALLRKALTLQFRQKITNICQIISPIMGLLFVLFIKSISEYLIKSHAISPIQLQMMPRFLNPPMLPNYVLYQLFGLNLDSCQQWYLYDFDPEDPAAQEFIGTLTGEKKTSQDQITASGVLQRISTYYCDSNKRLSPFFARPQESINEDIFQALVKIDKYPLHDHKSVYSAFLPDGALTIKGANSSYIGYTAQINDHRFASYHRNNGVTKIGLNKKLSNGVEVLTITDGMITLIDMFDQALFKYMFNGTEMITLLEYKPIEIMGLEEVDRLLNMVGGSLYPFMLSFLLPVFMYSLVLEKEQKLKDFMKMNGMKNLHYWMVNFGVNMGIYLSMVVFFWLFGAFVMDLNFFKETNLLIVAFFTLGWGVAQIGLAFFMQVFISKAKTASIWGYLLPIWSLLVSVTLNVTLFMPPDDFPRILLLYPHFALSRGIFIMCYQCGFYQCLNDIQHLPQEMNWCITSLWLIGGILLVISVYLNEAVPRQFGVAKHPLFCCKKQIQRSLQMNSNLGQPLPTFELDFEDGSVRKQRSHIYQMSEPYVDPLIIKDLSKTFKGKKGKPKKKAVDSLCLRLEQGEMIGILGPNGAGKTTLISMLTGLLAPDSGNAWVNGLDIKSHLDTVQLYMGFCPQFDILWSQLTVEQHLLFYARLKGISPAQEKEAVQKAMENIALIEFRDLKTSELSGGMRRRLSVAIALVGNPLIIFLDEPTTGLDPENRLQMWSILEKSREGRAIILSTHSMKEADVLCTKIAIINQGVMRCIGQQNQLKTLYGGGYHLFVNSKKTGGEVCHDTLEFIKGFVLDLLPFAVLQSEFNGNLVYQVPLNSCRVSEVFRVFSEARERVGIEDWGISQSSLEDVFFNVISD